MKLKSVLILIACVVTSVNAQIPIKVEDHNFSLTDKEYKGLTVNVPEVFYVNVKKAWVKNLESGTKSKISEARDGEISIFGANIKEISSEPINVYSQIMSGDSIINLAVAVEISRDKFITKNQETEAYNKLEDYLFDFAKNEYVGKVKVDVREEERKLNEIERELSKLQNQKKKLNRDIEQSKQAIANSEDELKILDSDLKLKNDELANLGATLESETNDVVKADLEEKLSEAKKEKRKILNLIDKEKTKISDNKTNIENAKAEIVTNETLQKAFPEKIQAQQNVVDFQNNKLEEVESY